MQQFQVKIFGPQFSEPNYFIAELTQRFGLSYRRTALTQADDAVEVVLEEYQGYRIIIASIIPFVLHKQDAYSRHIQGADGLIYMFSASRDMRQLNQEDFQRFAQIYHAHCTQTPLIALLNDVWQGACAAGYLNITDIKLFISPGVPIFKTQIGRGDQGGLLESLDKLLELMKGGEAHGEAQKQA